MARWTAPIAIVLVLLAALWVGMLAAQQTQPPERLDVQPRTKAQWLGAGSCGSTACHNSTNYPGEVGSEYVTWVARDPHAKAYQVLHNKRSHDIVEKLGAESKGMKPYELGLCLNCHVHRDYDASAKDHHPRFSKEDGVSCESCHGPASEWISDHYKTGWNRQGMWDTRSMTGRVQSCTPCHVGAPGMEVNHDLIAAGHPRLAFEFSAYHAVMPHHWPDRKDKVPGASERARTDWDAAAWFVGQVETTQAALELLSARKVWPEFAEYNCYACHHELEGLSWRRERDLAKRVDPATGKSVTMPGSLPWSDWYVSPLPYMLHAKLDQRQDLPMDVAELKTLMETSVVPNQEAVRRLAGKVAKNLKGLALQLRDHRYETKELQAMLKKLAERGVSREAESWDEAAQGYLAFVAIHQASSGQLRNPAVLGPLREIRDFLKFAPNVDSPSADYRPQKLLQLYGPLQKEFAK